jgi:hypothetical protein
MKKLTRVNFTVGLILLELMCLLARRHDFRIIPFRPDSSAVTLYAVPISDRIAPTCTLLSLQLEFF